MKTILIAVLALSCSAAGYAETLEAAKAQSGAASFSVNLTELADDAKALDSVEGSEALPGGIKTLAAAPESQRKTAAARKLESPAKTDKETEVLTCKKTPGTTLCRRLQKINQAPGYNCTGTACYGLFDTWTRELRSFSNEYLRVAGWEPKTDEDMSDLAFKAATSLCAKRLTGDAGVLTRVLMAANPALDNFLEIQKGASRENPKHCQLSLN